MPNLSNALRCGELKEMKPARWTEMTSWAVGIVLLGSYLTLRLSADWARRDGVETFQALRHVALAQTPTSRLSGPPRQSHRALWSQARMLAFQRTTLREKPEGILRIPALGLVVPIYPGTSSSELDRGAGHIQGTAALDSEGNAAIAGHRDGFFRKLGRMRIGQTLYVQTLSDTRAYRVTETRVVDPSDVSVLAPTARPSITLVTCYPFYFVGPAPRRFIVRAELFRDRRPAPAGRTADLSRPQE